MCLEAKTTPNFDFEWKEAERYPEFVKMGKDGWLEVAKKGYTTKYSEIKDNKLIRWIKSNKNSIEPNKLTFSFLSFYKEFYKNLMQ